MLHLPRTGPSVVEVQAEQRQGHLSPRRSLQGMQICRALGAELPIERKAGQFGHCERLGRRRGGRGANAEEKSGGWQRSSAGKGAQSGVFLNKDGRTVKRGKRYLFEQRRESKRCFRKRRPWWCLFEQRRESNRYFRKRRPQWYLFEQRRENSQAQEGVQNGNYFNNPHGIVSSFPHAHTH